MLGTIKAQMTKLSHPAGTTHMAGCAGAISMT